MKGDNLFRLCISNSDEMKRFLIKILVAVVFFFTLIMSVYFVLRFTSSETYTYDNDYVFVLGDSQIYQGLDVLLLGNRKGKPVLTSAGHGAGIYDFLVNEKSIPNNATCIIAFPECALLRNPMSDYNRTGFELSCLQSMFRAGCPLGECRRIANLNRQNIQYKTAFGNNHSIYPYSDSIVYSEPLAGFCDMFTDEKDYFIWKAEAYHQGISQLFKKHNQIILIQFPFEKQVEDCAYNSINRHLTDSLKFNLIGEYAMKHDTIVLHSDSLLMHDLSHMNEVGARMLTCQIADALLADTVNNRFFTVVIE